MLDDQAPRELSTLPPDHPTPTPTMPRFILAFTLTAIATSVSAAPQPTIAERCDAGSRSACERIALQTGGQCASPRGLGGCRFDSLSY